jgi:alkylation response protein AidB-like acyl-CoA dehydrogenase
MDENLTPEQREFKELVVRFARKSLNEGAKEREREGTFSREGWQRCAEFGLMGLPLPECYGGLGKDLLTCILAMEALGYACADSGLLFALNTHLWTCEMPILKFGTDAQRERYLPRLCSGELIGGHAISEAGAGSDAFGGMRTRAEKKGDRYILNGTKMFITNAPVADLLLVFAVGDKARGFAGISAFLVEKGFPGFSVGRPIDKLGLRTSPLGEVVLEDCEVPEENLLGRAGGGTMIFNSEMEWERSCLFATHLGAMEKLLEDTVAHVTTRKQFGQEIGRYQGVSHKVADMQVRIFLGRLALREVARIKASGRRAMMESAITKLFISEGYAQNCIDTLQLFGAYGYTTEFEVERHLRDSLAGKIYSGSSEIQRNIIASFLGL